MEEEKRLELIKEIKDKAEIGSLNIMTLYCLIATMTDKKLEEFHKEFMKKEIKPKKNSDE